MLKNFRDKIALSGVTVLMVGVALLIFTFASAYGFLTSSLSVVASENLVRTFGEALAPLIETCIRIMYLGVMGWIGSLLTIRGVTIIAQAPKMPSITHKKQVPTKQLPQKQKTEQPKEKAKPKEARTPEPEVIHIPPQPAQPQTPQPQQQESQSSQQSSYS